VLWVSTILSAAVSLLGVQSTFIRASAIRRNASGYLPIRPLPTWQLLSLRSVVIFAVSLLGSLHIELPAILMPDGIFGRDNEITV